MHCHHPGNPPALVVIFGFILSHNGIVDMVLNWGIVCVCAILVFCFVLAGDGHTMVDYKSLMESRHIN